MLLSHDYSHHIIPHFNKELKELYASIAIRGFARALIRVFEPIYLYLFFDSSLSKTFLFFSLIHLLFFVFAPFGGKILARVGLKHAMLFSMPFLFFYYFGLWHIESLGMFWPLIIISIVLFRVFYWPAYHTDFVKFSDKGYRGREVGFRTIILSITTSIAPLLGGLIIIKYGFSVLFIVTIFLLFASMAPLFLTKDVHEKYKLKYGEVFAQLFKKRNRKEVISFLFSGAETGISLYVWPLFLFLLAINFDILGIITSATLFFGIFVAYYVGKATDNVGNRKMLLIGGFINALFWPFRMFVTGPFNAFLAHSLHRFGRSAAYIPYSALFYDWAGKYKTNTVKIIIIRELALNLSAGIALAVLAVVFMDKTDLSSVFLVAGILSLGMLFMVGGPKDIAEDK